ncbi:hypothetical protein BFP70_16995 [Thioclava sp. SK-1]|uniref:DUF5337 family protein n=1 Tax=Thioclava sp. SK-1 TaxID=1889770 RepID=UPI0008253A0A|nr:DUF5337 family protein [Thioclava sp. SK-1]OCX61140.1 hypothetical protein BFP70_16995 [Thioclava sp. SK-1]
MTTEGDTVTAADRDAQDRRDGRLAAVVIAITTLLWIGFQWVGKQQGWGARIAILGDFAAIAAYIFALVQVWRIWRRKIG